MIFMHMYVHTYVHTVCTDGALCVVCVVPDVQVCRSLQIDGYCFCMHRPKTSANCHFLYCILFIDLVHLWSLIKLELYSLMFESFDCVDAVDECVAV